MDESAKMLLVQLHHGANSARAVLRIGWHEEMITNSKRSHASGWNQSLRCLKRQLPSGTDTRSGEVVIFCRQEM